ncbi:bifunctional phosphoribosylaminoimidazolecarboxamide formyltransferase/IMP cyclohydrolase [Latilactobacillus sakei]|uniref:bifunctional phosphoribosylaminoimidazolecarboxamide formyltransferase/IMP cyclohydrolase n=1 Tax=Latilactobacillus sakei TaxID=1599 RepID=UPI000C1292B3|nr:bifunctional phosphoribosylaminoimidazolecarboxamide formyltransferase/IMP cyclohydrolase [Latilactobacillus sakei]AWZ42963.1 bifunctional phosphoribosylaminoimidazolecarboxamide formyltransferase/IMP cyclohydrolase PurH [Latilactobacillus sakei]AWZ43924.1 bifunctional phosphoribosylaminoimidazolecarboxamide formyltransferase/IMP cyclohydrolase PurH [Latilactobacillus sakei]QVQ49615.1 bifunctional phosphoribosylaminoimidazolecarboxamide formyltransferase/IMP cyclohydrolase [Latilactobacillus 
MKRALISVSDKTGIVAFAQGLVAADFEIISTGGTFSVLEKAGVPVTPIDEVTHFPEMLDGRVKTLHPNIHGGLLAKRDEPTHMAALAEHEITPIDLVCVNLYPFKETIQKPEITQAQAIEQIDIGGPSMLRSAAKNFKSVYVVVDQADYDETLAQLQQDDVTYRHHLAAKAFRHTAAYDSLIAGYLSDADAVEFPEKLSLTYDFKQALRYGENAHQKAAFYQSALPSAFSIAAAHQLHGKELSYNNIKDADAAIKVAAEFSEPCVVAMKHMNPCGVGLGTTIYDAWQKAFAADSVSIFGGIIALNREVDVQTANALHELFLEIVIAPSFAPEALAILEKKKNIRLMTLDFEQAAKADRFETVSVLGGLLVQERDRLTDQASELKTVTTKAPTEDEKEALLFAQRVVKHVKSNAIVVATKDQTLGVGAGQMNRVGSVKIALEQALANGMQAPFVLASDAFFPMDDSVAYAAEHGITAIIQPGGSIKDQDSIDMANQKGVSMVFTNRRHFKH